MRALLAIAVLLTAARAPAQELFVATDGNDGNPGTREHPLATLEAARDAAHALHSRTVTVWLRGGVYQRDASFRLGAADSGSVYRGFSGEQVRLVGGRELKHFTPLTDPGALARLPVAALTHVLEADLAAAGIHDLGTRAARGFRRAVKPDALELFFGDRPMPLARWPNDGWGRIVAAPGVGRIQYAEAHAERWRAADAWLHGYWSRDWADSYEKVAAIDPAQHELTTVAPHGVYGYRAGQRFVALNLLEELDEPGEWYVDRARGKLYFWAPAPLATVRAFVSTLGDPLLVLDGTSNVTVRDLVMEVARGTGAAIIGGAHNRFVGCTVRNVGGVGIIVDGTDNGVIDCEVTGVGEDGIQLRGGDRRTHVRGDNFVLDSRVHGYARVVRTYTPAIHVWGVGNRVAHNHLSDAPHIAVLLHGDDHTVEHNEIDHVCLETSDAGAVYLGRDPSERGNAIRDNYFHDLGTGADVRAVYLDDFASGTEISGNLFERVAGILVGGGRDNRIVNNLFREASPAVIIDARGLTWARGSAVRPARGLPRGNQLVGNRWDGGRWLELRDHLDPGLVDERGTIDLRMKRELDVR